MKKGTIKDAIIKVLNEKNEPMIAKEIYQTIVDKGYYQFGAKNPTGIVSGVLREHSIGTAGKEVVFKKESNNAFSLVKK